MTAYSERFAADLRRTVLAVLAAAMAETNLPILRAAVAESSPHDPSMAQLRAEIVWLADKGLVHMRRIGAAIEGCTITERGDDVAAGRERVMGVAPPETA